MKPQCPNCAEDYLTRVDIVDAETGKFLCEAVWFCPTCQLVQDEE